MERNRGILRWPKMQKMQSWIYVRKIGQKLISCVVRPSVKEEIVSTRSVLQCYNSSFVRPVTTTHSSWLPSVTLLFGLLSCVLSAWWDNLTVKNELVPKIWLSFRCLQFQLLNSLRFGHYLCLYCTSLRRLTCLESCLTAETFLHILFWFWLFQPDGSRQL